MQAARKSTFHGRTLFRAVTLVEKKSRHKGDKNGHFLAYHTLYFG